jgi:hypothetical protein
MSSSSVFLLVLYSLTKDNIDIINYFIELMTCEIWWTPLLRATIKLILHTLKLAFH